MFGLKVFVFVLNLEEEFLIDVIQHPTSNDSGVDAVNFDFFQ